MHTKIRSRSLLAVATCMFAFGGASHAVAAPGAEQLLLVAYGQDVGSQYVTLTTQGYILLKNLGANTVHVTNISSTDLDVIGGFIVLVTPRYPINISPGDSARVYFTFAPNAVDIISGERLYSGQFTITSDVLTPSPLTATAVGHGVLVRAHTSMSTTNTGKVGDTIDMPVTIDQWTDPLGLANVRSMRVDVLHYRRTIVGVLPGYNTSGAGQLGTLTAGATVTEDVAADTLKDPGHTSGEQGYYSLIVNKTAAAIQSTGTLMKLRFKALKGTDTSRIVYRIRDFSNIDGATLPYVIVTNTAGLIHVDSLKKDTTTAVRFVNATPTQSGLLLNPSAPNPFSSSTDISFTLADRSRAELYVCDVRGGIVAKLVEGEFSAGEHHTRFSAGTLPSGEYYAVLHTPAGILKQEMALVR